MKKIIINESQIRRLFFEELLFEDYGVIYDKYYKEKVDRNTFEEIVSSDPTSNDSKMGNYCKWILNLFLTRKLKLEDLYKVTEYLTIFHKYKNNLEIKDINRYKTLPDLYTAVQPFEAEDGVEKFASNGEEERYIKANETERVFEDDNWIVVIPKTERAAKYYGKGTKWCTAATEERYNQFEYYNEQGPLYININKQNGEKYQFHFESKQFMDERDNEAHVPYIEDIYPLIEFYHSKNLQPLSLTDYFHGDYGHISDYYMNGETPSDDDLQTAIRYVQNNDMGYIGAVWDILTLTEHGSLADYEIDELIEIAMNAHEEEFDTKIEFIKLIMEKSDRDNESLKIIHGILYDYVLFNDEVAKLSDENDELYINLKRICAMNEEQEYVDIYEFDLEDLEKMNSSSFRYHTQLVYRNRNSSQGKTTYEGMLSKEQIYNYLTNRSMFNEQRLRKFVKQKKGAI